MKIERVEDYATGIVSPHVHALLYQLHQTFGCGVQWTKLSQHPFGSDQTMTAAPLDNEEWLSYLTLSTTGEAAFGEHTWHVSSELPPRQLGSIGRVNLEACVSVSIDVMKGTPVYMSDDGSMPGFLCWAEPHVLHDESVCYRLQTSAGVLWLRPHGTGASLVELLYRKEAPVGERAHVVHLADTYCHLPRLSHYMGSGPWSGFKTLDDSQREWHIGQSTLEYAAHVRLRARQYNDRLKSRPITVLQPPYEAIWQPDGQHGVGLPLELVVSR